LKNANRLLFLPFFLGITLMLYSFCLTYPLSTGSSKELAFVHISPYYWLSIPLLLVSMFLMALTTKNQISRWLLAIGIVFTWFSLSYFYLMMPTPDSQFFRGLLEYFFKTRSLDPSQINHGYYQWPAFFIFSKIAMTVSGLQLKDLEFLLYAVIGFLLATVLYVYASKKFTNGGILVVPAFFIGISYFMNYQAVPFSFGLALLFLSFMVETGEKNKRSMLILLILYACLLTTHLFLPLFFVLYLLARSFMDKKNRTYYGNLFLFSLISYLLVELTVARFSFDSLIINLTQAPIENFSFIASNSIVASAPNIISSIAQFFSRTTTIVSIGVCIVGLILLLIKKELSDLDKAILLTGLLYSGLGQILNILGWRAIAVAFIPISLGIAYLFESRFKKFLITLVIVLLTIAVFVPLHQSLDESAFQTKETYISNNFFIDHYNYTRSSFVVGDISSVSYLYPKLNSYQYIHQYLTTNDNPNVILNSPILQTDLGSNVSVNNFSIEKGLNLLYNDASFNIYIKPTVD
jgi:hypothetical protein